jgi:translation initiation factor IF-2
MVKNMAEKRAEALLNPDKETDTTPAAAPTFSVIVKTDVNGSLEAILNVMETYEAHHKVRLDLVHFDVGPVKKTDMDMAELFNSVVYAFNLPANPEVEASASKMTVTVEGSSSAEKKSRVRHFNVIYKMFDDMRSEINERVVSVDKEELIGEATVLQVFDYTEEKKKGTITVAGGRCLSGMLDRKANFRLVRGGTVVKEKLTCHSLKHVKTDVSTIKQNVEFGLAFEQKNVTPEKGDTIVCYNLKKVKEPVEWNLGF